MKLVFTRDKGREKVLANSKRLKALEENNVLRKVFIKKETSPLIRKENGRLYRKLQTLKAENPDDQHKYKLEKGKLKCEDIILDEFNIIKSLFL